MHELDEVDICRVCGLYEKDSEPWGPDGKSTMFFICACCGTESGYEDCTLQAILNARQRWLDAGAPWFAELERPAEWSLERQLAQIPPRFRGELDDGSSVHWVGAAEARLDQRRPEPGTAPQLQEG